MVRLFTWLAILVAGMILTTGICVYWLSRADVNQSRHQEAEAIAQSAALNLAMHIEQLNVILEQMAQDPDVVAAVLNGNKSLLDRQAGKLEKYLPDVLKIRLLPPDISAPDETSSPRMGFADLEMVRQSLTIHPLSAVQGEKTDRHLAIARQIAYQDHVVGVLLASLNYGFIQKNVAAAATNHVYLQLRQNKTVLASAGEAGDDDFAETQVPGTDWTIDYQSNESLGSVDLLILAATLIPLLVGLLALLSGYRRLSEVLSSDIQNLLKAFKDLMTNNLQGNYPFQLNELSALFSNLLQFKRVLDQRSDYAKTGDEPKMVGASTREFNEFSTAGQDITVEEDDFDLDRLFDDFDKSSAKPQ